MVEHAICIRCGAEKAAPCDRCGDCHFKPDRESDDMARSLYLSEFRYSDPNMMEGCLTELELVAQRLRRGESYDFESAEVQRMRSVAEKLASQPASAAYRALFRFLLPGLIFLALLWGAILLLRFLR